MNELSAEYVKARKLDRTIKTSAQLAQQSLYDMCAAFKEMRDSKLYKELGYTDFREYCEKETGFKHAQIYSYIAVYEKLPKEFVQSTGQIGIQKLYLLSTLSEEERVEVTQSTDLESTTVKELKEQITALKEKADKADMFSSKLDNMVKNCNQIQQQKDNAESKIKKLESEIKELESRPVEVAVEDNSEQLQELRKKLEAEKQQALKKAEKSAQKEINELKNQLGIANDKIKEQTNGLKVDEEKIKFKDIFTFAYDAMKRLTEFAKSSSENIYIDKVKEFLQAIEQDLEC